jgi:putative sigma-54 modulation protein
MKLVIQGKNIEITESLREYVTAKLDKAFSHFQFLITEVDANLSIAKNRRINTKQFAEITAYVNGSVIRAEEGHENLYAAIDLVADKIHRKLRKYKEKRYDHKQSGKEDVLETLTNIPESLAPVPDLLRDKVAELPREVVRSKYFAMPPMSVDAAMEQLEMIGHDFYMFMNEETGQINVLYERGHGGVGLIQPRINGQVHQISDAKRNRNRSQAPMEDWMEEYDAVSH